jgi:hypothetical protein
MCQHHKLSSYITLFQLTAQPCNYFNGAGPSVVKQSRISLPFLESEFSYHLHKYPPLDPIFSQMSPNHILSSVPYAVQKKPPKSEAACNISCGVAF